MAAAFNSTLAKEACRQLQMFIDRGIVLSMKETDALTKYFDTLEILLKNIHPNHKKTF
jgi:hypothetical protein